MKNKVLAVVLCLVFPLLAWGGGKKDPPSLAGKKGKQEKSQKKEAKKEKSQKSEKSAGKGSPSLAKKSNLPPGLEKKFGSKRPDVAWVAFDPKQPDRAWLLVGGTWKLETNFDGSLQREVKTSLAMPMSTPPVPLPKVDTKLHVVKFE
jgi:hypothetical protein